jgi:hypothetical protein
MNIYKFILHFGVIFCVDLFSSHAFDNPEISLGYGLILNALYGGVVMWDDLIAWEKQ